MYVASEYLDQCVGHPDGLATEVVLHDYRMTLGLGVVGAVQVVRVDVVDQVLFSPGFPAPVILRSRLEGYLHLGDGDTKQVSHGIPGDAVRYKLQCGGMPSLHRAGEGPKGF